MVTLIGNVREQYVKDSEVYAVGSLKINVITSDKVVVLVGSGKTSLLASNVCILFAVRRPLIVNNAYCGSALVIGMKSPVVVGYLRARKVYARRIYVQRLSAVEAVLGELCVVEELEVLERTVFADPHMYVKKVISTGEIGYTYKVLE